MTGAFLRISDSRSVELRFTARRAEALENDLGESLLRGLARADRVGVAVEYLRHGADISKDEAYDLYDEYIGCGGSLNDLCEVILKALENGGFISKKAAESAKKLKGQLEDRAAQLS